MPLKKLTFKPGVNRENTRYTTEGGWYECDKIRFRQGLPEKIGGWQRLSGNTFAGLCRSIWEWTTLGGSKSRGIGTEKKLYVERGGEYHDITPLRATENLTDPFDTTSGSSTVTVTDAAGGYFVGDYVTFSGASAVGGLTIDGEYVIQSVGSGDYTIDAGSNASSTATGGSSVTAKYQINVGPATQTASVGWGSGGWGSGTWGSSSTGTDKMRLWSQANFGEDLIASIRDGAVYYWDSSAGTGTRAVELSTLGGASNTPTVQTMILVSDVSRFVFAFGANVQGESSADPLLVRWSDQEDAANWTPAATNQAGSLRLSRGSKIVSAKQARQEILVWTDSALYSLQFLGAPDVWGAQIVGENLSIVSQRAVAYSNGVAYWMGFGTFYRYDGTVSALRCDLRKYVFNDINSVQVDQIFAGTCEEFNEVWWFYCSDGSTTVDKYVVYNYVQDIWYYGSLARTAWLDSPTDGVPIAATYDNILVAHETGVDNNETSTSQAIEAYILSSEFDLSDRDTDGDSYMFVWRALPDVTFDGSTASSPSVTLSLLPLGGSGSGYNDPKSEGGSSSRAVTRTATAPVEAYTDQVNIRVRGRQIALKLESSDIGVQWQMGFPRLDMRPDGRKS